MALARFVATTPYERVEIVRAVVAAGLKRRTVRVRQPLRHATIVTRNPHVFRMPEHRRTLLEQWNVKAVTVLLTDDLTDATDQPDCVHFDTELTPELIAEGKARDEQRADRRQRKGVYRP